MNREEFILELRKSLAGKMSASKIEEHARYYEQYIDIQISKGMSETDVLDSLGPARLIAKTLTNTGKKQSDVYEQQEEKKEESQSKQGKFGRTGFSTNLITILVVIFAILVIIAIIGLAITAIWFLLPVIAILLVVGFIIKIFKK